MIFAINLSKNIARPVRNFIRNKIEEIKIDKLTRHRAAIEASSFDFEKFKFEIKNFLQQMKNGKQSFAYRYSSSCTKPTLYASAYACMTLSLLGELDKLSEEEKNEWGKYFDSFQRAQDGLFYDNAVHNELYNDTDWWGARHLALHMISAYTDLGVKPKFRFKFLEQYYLSGSIRKWLDSFDWGAPTIGVGDVDNKIMNIGCLLQYQRDAWGDGGGASAVDELKSYLKVKLNPSSGMWGGFDLKNKDQQSRAVQFAYHLFPIFFYDNDFDFDIENIVNTVLATQNKYGGYGVKPNSSACEDIDSIDILIRLHPFCSRFLQGRIDASIRRAFNWVALNQVNDGGFVFRLNEPFVYGSRETSSLANAGAMLPTWFRTLSLAYMTRHLHASHHFKLTNCPGYELQ
jgi:hypothetical protein